MDEALHLPRHIGIIMDGNGRWATERGKKRSYGHKAGTKVVDKIVSHAFACEVYALTLYAFSSENWQRPQEEVDEIMRLLKSYLVDFTKKMVKNKVRLVIAGDRSALSPELNEVIDESMEKTIRFSDHILTLAINYGGRQEIVHAVNRLIKSGKEVSTQNISDNLYTSLSGDPDLIIRTGGEIRLSNFLLFQGAYSELYFTDVLWPDFTEEDFDKALQDFSHRKRRFGKI